MPLDHVAAESDRTAFVGALEEVVQRFAVGDRAPSSAQRSAYPSSTSIEAEELRALLEEIEKTADKAPSKKPASK